MDTNESTYNCFFSLIIISQYARKKDYLIAVLHVKHMVKHDIKEVLLF